MELNIIYLKNFLKRHIWVYIIFILEEKEREKGEGGSKGGREGEKEEEREGGREARR